MNTLIFLTLMIAGTGFGQTTLQLRPLNDTHNCVVVGTNNSSPDQITCAGAVNFSLGDRLVCANFSGDTAPNRDDILVRGVSGSTFTIEDLSHIAIAGNGAWNNGDYTLPAGLLLTGNAQICGKTQTYTMQTSHPYLWSTLTGRSGIEMAAKVNNGLLASIEVSNNTAAATYTRAHGLSAGMKIAVFGSSTSAINTPYGGVAYTILSTPTPTTLTFATSGVGDGVYNNSTLCISAWAITGNPPWDAMSSSTFDAQAAGFYSGAPANPITQQYNYYMVEDMAARCYIDELTSGPCTGGLYGIDHFENWTSFGSFALWESGTDYVDDGQSLDYGVRIGAEIARSFDLMMGTGNHRPNSTEIANFTGKAWNGMGNGVGCAKPTKTVGSGTVAIQYGGAGPYPIVGTGTHFTTEMSVGYVLDSPPVLSVANGLLTNVVVLNNVAVAHLSRTVTVIKSCVGSPGNTGGPYKSYCDAGGGAFYLCANGLGCTVAGDWSSSSISFVLQDSFITHLDGWYSATAATANMLTFSTSGVADGTYAPSKMAISNSETSGERKVYVTAIADDTHASGWFAGQGPVEGLFSIGQSWQPGQCGYLWWATHDAAMWPGQPITSQPLRANLSVPWTNQTWSHIGGTTWAFGLATAPHDSRGAYAAELGEQFFVDHMAPTEENWQTGQMGFGTVYDYGVGVWAEELWAIEMANAVVNGPNLAGLGMYQWAGPWARYSTLPGLPSPSDASRGSSRFYQPATGGNGTLGWENADAVSSVAGSIGIDPTGAEAAKTMYWLRNSPVWTSGYLSSTPPGMAFEFAWPTIGAVNFASDATTKLFKPTPNQYADCLGAGQQSWQFQCKNPWGFQYVFSRTGWDYSSSSHDTQLRMTGDLYEQDHSAPRYGETWIWKGDEIIGGDQFDRVGDGGNDPYNTGRYSRQLIGTDTGLISQYTEGYTHGIVTPNALTPQMDFDRVAFDSNTYTYAHLDMSSLMQPGSALDYGSREWIHAKDQSLTGEYIFIHTYFDSHSIPRLLTGDYIHYQPNNQAGEGDTTCPASGGCASFGTGSDTEILSLTTKSGVHTKFVPVGNSSVFLNATNGTYPGGAGNSFRVSGCAVTSGTTCDAAATSYEMVQVHRLFWGTTDPGLTVTALNPDANWTGAQTESAVALFARGNSTHSAPANFTTTHTSTAQYTIAGLSSGTYSVKVNGALVSGSPFTVAAGGNALEFESTAGVVNISTGAAAPATVSTGTSGTMATAGNVTIR